MLLSDALYRPVNTEINMNNVRHNIKAGKEKAVAGTWPLATLHLNHAVVAAAAVVWGQVRHCASVSHSIYGFHCAAWKEGRRCCSFFTTIKNIYPPWIDNLHTFRTSL